MTAPTYEIRTLSDFFSVPADRREAMFRELALSLALCELTRGAAATLDAFTWTDDADVEVVIESPGSGDDGIRLRVSTDGRETKKTPPE